VTGIVTTAIFKSFIRTLLDNQYIVDYRPCYGTRYGLPQFRRRLVLVASRIGPVEVPSGSVEEPATTVREAIGGMPEVRHGEADPDDPLHAARKLTDINLSRMKASQPGGTWEDWPSELRAPCHRKTSGGTFRSVYARMEWDKPSPTITTQAHNFGTGRFGHPEQDRAITLREAAILQGFPYDYRFVRPGGKVEFAPLGKLIGNAVPPPLGKAIGDVLVERGHCPETMGDRS
jgi:DNA (cytosine-5)-methyltransferase 1